MQPANIAILINPQTGVEYNIRHYAVSIGREIGNDIVLNADKTISRQHAVMYCLNGSYFVEDIGSKNGSRLNDRPIASRTAMNSGDELRLGNTRLLFLLLQDKQRLPSEALESSRPTAFLLPLLPIFTKL